MILSGGNTLSKYSDHKDKPEHISIERDEYEMALIKLAILNNIPILGVCRGLQVLNVYYGGKIKKISGHAGVKHI